MSSSTSFKHFWVQTRDFVRFSVRMRRLTDSFTYIYTHLFHLRMFFTLFLDSFAVFSVALIRSLFTCFTISISQYVVRACVWSTIFCVVKEKNKIVRKETWHLNRERVKEWTTDEEKWELKSKTKWNKMKWWAAGVEKVDIFGTPFTFDNFNMILCYQSSAFTCIHYSKWNIYFIVTAKGHWSSYKILITLQIR